MFFSNDFRYSGTLEATKVDLSSEVSVENRVGQSAGREPHRGKPIVRLAHPATTSKSQRILPTKTTIATCASFKGGSASQEILDQMKNHKDDAEVRLGWCEIKSPIKGTVLSRYHEPGEWVMPGTKLLTLANIRDIWAYIYVPQPEVARLKPGMKLKGHLPELGDRAFEGTILKINDEAEFTPKNVQTRSERQRLVFGVKVSFLGVQRR